MTNSSDVVALDLIRERRPEGMEMLYDWYGRVAYSLAFRMLGDEGSAQDVVQDAFLSVWLRVSTYEPSRGSLRAWLCAVVHNRALDMLRGRTGRARENLPLDVVTDRGDADEVWGEVTASLARDHVRAALAGLPAEQRQTLELAYYAGYSQQEISRTMSVPLGTVKGRTQLALRKLRATLEGQGFAGSAT